MTVKSYANSVILILFAISDNLSAENSKLSADSWNRGNNLLGCMVGTNASLGAARPAHVDRSQSLFYFVPQESVNLSAKLARLVKTRDAKSGKYKSVLFFLVLIFGPCTNKNRNRSVVTAQI